MFSLAWSDSPGPDWDSVQRQQLCARPFDKRRYCWRCTWHDQLHRLTPVGHLTHDSFNLTNIITGVTDYTGARPGQTSGITTVGNMRFSVSYKGFAVPGPEAKPSQGAISFDIGLRAGCRRRSHGARAVEHGAGLPRPDVSRRCHLPHPPPQGRSSKRRRLNLRRHRCSRRAPSTLAQFFGCKGPAVTDSAGKPVDFRYGGDDTALVHLPTNVSLAPGKEMVLGEVKWPTADLGTGKFTVQYERVFGKTPQGRLEVDPTLKDLGTGKLDLEIKSEPPPAAIEKK